MNPAMNPAMWLKGANLIVLNTMQEMLARGERVSVRRVAARVAYSEMTVLRAMKSLRALGLVSMQQCGSGHSARYCLRLRE